MTTLRERQELPSQPGGTAAVTGIADVSIAERLNASATFGLATDVALVNLLCASDLPGADALDVERYLQWLDDAARQIDFETKRHYHKFLDSPADFENLQARFCVVCLVTVLQQQFGVKYNPKWKGLTPDSPVPRDFGVDSSDLFIHAIIDGVGGTCGSLPVLYTAIGRRLGYPLRLVKAARHLFVRWDDPNGEQWHHPARFNVEATGPGVHFLPDEHYRTWPHPISDDDLDAGIFLRSLTQNEESAEFLATRGYCLSANRRLSEALEAFAEASRLSPVNRRFAESSQSLRSHIAALRRGHAFVNVALPTIAQEAIGPFWIDGIGGEKVLAQIVSPITQPFSQPPAVGRPLSRQLLRTPDGLEVEAWVPVHGSNPEMTAHWIGLPDGRQALVHKPLSSFESSPIHGLKRAPAARSGHPILPDSTADAGFSRWGHNPINDPFGTSPYEFNYLGTRLSQELARLQSDNGPCDSTLLKQLPLPIGPAAPQLAAAGGTAPLIT